MANLQLNIEVNDEEFKNLCTNNINSLPQDKVQELLLKAVEVALLRDKEKPYSSEENILVSKVKSYSSAYYDSYKYEPTDLLKEVMKKVDLAPYMEGIAETIKDYIETNYKEMIRDYVVKRFADMIFNDDNKYKFRDEIIGDMNACLESKFGR